MRTSITTHGGNITRDTRQRVERKFSKDNCLDHFTIPELGKILVMTRVTKTLRLQMVCN